MFTRQDISIRHQEGACAFQVTIDINLHASTSAISTQFKPILPALMDHIHLDIGLLLVAYLFRRGCFGTRSVASIIAGTDERVRTESAFDNEPLFLNFRGRVMTNELLTRNMATRWLANELVRAGMDRKYLVRSLTSCSYDLFGSNASFFRLLSAQACEKARYPSWP